LPQFWGGFFVTDLLNLIIPAPTNFFGGAFANPLSRHFPGFSSEQSGYLGLPLVIILWVFLRRGHRFSGALLLALLALSLGPRLVLLGHATSLPLPWALLRPLPLLGNALPARLMLYVALAAALAAARWVAEAPPGRAYYRRVAFGLLAALCLWPMPRPVQPIPAATFFAPGQVEAALGKKPQLLILPFGFYSPSSYWQVESGFAFAQTGGYLGFPPTSMQRNKVMINFYFENHLPGLPAAFAAYCRSTGTQYVVAEPGAPADITSAMTGWGWTKRHFGDADVYTVR
jgi:hypothetical protein